jgi:adenylate kinase
MNLILLGAQGSGKGTQAQILSERMNLKSCASGDLLREAIAKKTAAGVAAQPYYERGELVPDAIVVDMILDAIRERGSADGIILDGFPRTQAQAETLDSRLGEMGERIDRVVYLDVPREMLVERLSGRYICKAHGHVWNVNSRPPAIPGVCDFDGSPLYQRSDDTGEKIARRLDIFFSETVQLVDYYQHQGKLIRVDGTRGIDEVTVDILVGLGWQGALAGDQNERNTA